ncbi:MAG: hypothetical protein M1451_08870 [Acidobacteria bacterium]|nr:hypothetical protein [Acidobacteriota bacterium]
MRKKTVLVVLICLCFAACQPYEKQARDSVAAAKGFIEQAQANHGDECRAVPQCSLPGVVDAGKCVKICAAINQAVAAQNLAIDALDLYCAGTGWQTGGACTPNKELEPRVRAAISNLDRIIKDAKGAVGK